MRLKILVFLSVLVAGAVRADAQSHILNADIFRFNAGPCAITSVDGSPDKIVLSQCPVLSTAAATNLTLNPTGDLILGPDGHDVLPDVGYTQNLGSLQNKYLTLHAAELWVETLVAQNTIATIGGRVLVAPTNTLTSDLNVTTTTIAVKYNNLFSGDRVYLEANGKVEFMSVNSGPSGTGPFTYTVTRNIDGSGPNLWYAGDAVLDTGTTGNGFIDLYSTAGVLSGSGPTIVGNVRTGTAFNAIAPRWAIGNLDGTYGYGVTTWGAAFGDATATNVTVDANNGFRIRNGTTTKLAADTAGNLALTGDLSIGPAGAIRSSSATSMTTGDGFYMTGGATPSFRIGNPAGNRFVYDAISGTAAFFGDASGATNLNVGAGRNMIRNSDCAVSATDWSVATSSAETFSLSLALSPWRLNDVPNTCYMTTAGTPVNATSSWTLLTAPFPVQAGHRYEASAYLGVHRSGDTQALIWWYDSGGTLLSAATGNACTAANSGGTTLVAFCRSGVVATAPVGAVNARPVIFTMHNGGANPFVFFVHTYFGEALGFQTDLTAWGPAGMTSIVGDLIETGSIVTRNLAADSVTAGKINVSSLSAISADLGSATAGQFVVGGSDKIWLNEGGDGVLAVGGGTKGSAPFHVGADGSVSMSSATVTGGSLNIGGGTFQVDSSGNVTMASASITGGDLDIGGNFQVSSFGFLTATAATFNQGMTINLTGPSIISIPSFGGGGSRRLCVDNFGQVGAGGC